MAIKADRTTLNLRDAIAIGITILITIAILIIAVIRFPTSSGSTVEVRYQNRVVNTYDLSVNKTITFCRDDVPAAEGFVCDYSKMEDFKGPLVQLEIIERSIRISKETSSRKLCSTQGSISRAYTPLVCLPNSFMAVIVGGKDSGFDA